jgi:hypothetical protein
MDKENAASIAVGIVAENDGPERAHEISHPECRQSDEQGYAFVCGGEEHFCDRYREEAVDDKVEPFECIAKGCSNDRLPLKRGA